MVMEKMQQQTKRRLATLARHLPSSSNYGGLLIPDECSAAASASSELGPKESLAKERRNAGFDLRGLTYLLDGSEELTKAKELAMQMIERDPVLRMDRPYDMSLEEARDK